MKYRFLFMVVFFSISFFNSKAQFSKEDSTFLNSVFTEPTYISYWNKPGKWFVNKEITSKQDMYDQLDDNYKFYSEDYINCYQKMKIESDLELDSALNYTWNNFEDSTNIVLYGIRNPFVQVKFKLNNKEAYTYAVLDSSDAINPTQRIAFYISEGTGTNIMSEFLQGNGYHNLHCSVKNFLKQYGDVYSLGIGDEDHRAIYFNKKKMGVLAPAQPTYFQTYLAAANRPYGVNRMIETVAMIKYLKSKYDKVFVLGLSTGGKVALWASLEAEPDAALISAGYTVLADNSYITQLINSYAYANYLLTYDKDSTRKWISKVKTQFLFTQADNDNSIAQQEVDSNYTQKFFAGLTNTSFFYDYEHHSFPPCLTIDTFFTRCTNKPSCKVKLQENVCNSDTIHLFVDFFGKPPFSYDLYKDSVFYSSYTCNSLKDTLVISSSGVYNLRNITDSTMNPGYPSDYFSHFPGEQVFGQINVKEYNCDSMKTEVEFVVQGTKPWKIFYEKDNVFDSLKIYNTYNSMYLDNGKYAFWTLSDSNHCIYALNDILEFNSQNPEMTYLGTSYDSSHKSNTLNFKFQGQSPWTFNVYDLFNGSSESITKTDSLATLKYNDGVYHITGGVDGNGCSFDFDKMLVFDHNIDLGKLLVFPNPIHDYFHVFIDLNHSEKADYSIQDAYGAELNKGSFSNGMNKILCPNLPRGVYILKILSDNMWFKYNSVKLIKL